MLFWLFTVLFNVTMPYLEKKKEKERKEKKKERERELQIKKSTDY